ncbi:hypothetical protein DRQ20_06065 [bacterium]|nr:MAG: hypothetical protein DRQ20_06065 [bacterium]
MELTRRLEEYLEVIFLIAKEKRVVRVKDLVKRLGVRAPSVVETLRSLEEKGLVVHERYGHVELTDKGRKKAKEVYKKHGIIKEFFEEVLKLPEDVAERDACLIEHYISKETLDRLLKFIEFIKECPGEEPFWLSGFQYYLETGKKSSLCKKMGEHLRLSDLKIGEKVRVVRVEKKALRKRLGTMGIFPGVEVEVMGKGPFGNPIELKVKGSKLALSSDEAACILVEKEEI